MNSVKRVFVKNNLKSANRKIEFIEKELPDLKTKFEETQTELANYKEKALEYSAEIQKEENKDDPNFKKQYASFQNEFKVVTKRAGKASEKYNKALTKIENLKLKAKFYELDLEGKLHETHSDIMRYKNNKASFWLCILAICLNVAMFLIIYKDKNCTPDVQLGIDLLINILVLLAAFLIAEKTKTYNVKGGYFAIGLGVIEALRIFWNPLRYFNQYLGSMNTDTVIGLSTDKFIWCAALLIGAALALIGAGIICLQKSKRLTEHLKTLEEGGK